MSDELQCISLLIELIKLDSKSINKYIKLLSAIKNPRFLDECINMIEYDEEIFTSDPINPIKGALMSIHMNKKLYIEIVDEYELDKIYNGTIKSYNIYSINYAKFHKEISFVNFEKYNWCNLIHISLPKTANVHTVIQNMFGHNNLLFVSLKKIDFNNSVHVTEDNIKCILNHFVQYNEIVRSVPTYWGNTDMKYVMEFSNINKKLLKLLDKNIFYLKKTVKINYLREFHKTDLFVNFNIVTPISE